MSQLPAGSAASGGGDGGVAADPLLVATAFRGNRFYCFSRREPAEMLASAADGGALCVVDRVGWGGARVIGFVGFGATLGCRVLARPCDSSSPPLTH